MTVDAKALTLIDYALLTTDPLTQAVTYSLISSGSAMQDIPFKDKKILKAEGLRFEGNLPTVSWVPANTEGVTTKGTPTPFHEQAFILRNNIDVDKVYVEAENQIVDPRGLQVSAYLRSQAYDFNDKLINNAHDGTGDPNSIVGLKARIDNGATYGVRSENKIDAGAVVMTSALTAATFSTFLEFIDKALWSVNSPDGMNCVIYLNDVMWRRWERGARQTAGQGGFETSKDQLGRTISRYKNAIIRDIGRKSDQSSYIVTSTENADGTAGSSTHTSIYVVRYDMEHLFGWQFEKLIAKDLGLLNNGMIYRTFIDWVGGIYAASNRCMARIHGIKLA